MNKPNLTLRKNSIKFMTFGVKSKIRIKKKVKLLTPTSRGELMTSLLPRPHAQYHSRYNLHHAVLLLVSWN